ncbi:MAG: mucin-5AC [Marmoricola sp.]|nr:mucin-5AC [Marmoricola sp.]
MPNARVTDDHVLVDAGVEGPVVVHFDDQYVWSFSPRRDGRRDRSGWTVPWPPVLVERLDGRTRVRLSSPDGDEVHLDAEVAFGTGGGRLQLVDRHGDPLAVDRAGHLTRTFAETGPEVRRRVAEGSARAIADLQGLGFEAHVSYGALLGAVRDGRMIGHDTDSDLAYLSRHTHPVDVVRESFRMEREMRLLGWKVVRMSAADLKLFLPVPEGAPVQIDVFGAFHVGGTFYQLGARSGTLPRSALLPLSTVTLEGVELAAPADPEAVLEFLYGPGWRVPDPSFQNVDPAPGVRRLDGWTRGVRTNLLEWNDILRRRRKEVPRERSPFCADVLTRIPDDAVVVDLGPGTGRDAAAFAREGHDVLAYDYSGAAVHHTGTRLHRSGGDRTQVRVLPLNDLRAVLLAGAELARLPRQPHLYARGLVGCLDQDGRDNLWLLCSMALRRGGTLHLELAASAPGLEERSVEGLVQRLDVDRVVQEITAAGGEVVRREVGPGEDFFGAPDPAVARLEVRWTSGRATVHSRQLTTAGASTGTDLTTTSTTAGAEGTPRGGTVFEDVISEAPGAQDGTPRLTGRVRRLRARLQDLEASVQENRRLNRRVAELTDVVAELLVPLADRDEEAARKLLEDYRRTTLAP